MGVLYLVSEKRVCGSFIISGICSYNPRLFVYVFCGHVRLDDMCSCISLAFFLDPPGLCYISPFLLSL